MLYAEFLKTITKCPFCNTKNRTIQENEHAFLTYALAPYSPYHLLVLPKRHIETFLELTDTETRDIEKLLRTGARLLELLGQTDYSILVRNGNNIGKSITHLHFHIVPNITIGSREHGGNERRVLTSTEIDALMRECTNVLTSS
jgi:diadenosine tetraphosphate (Ap4A) HIT family hydrolase